VAGHHHKSTVSTFAPVLNGLVVPHVAALDVAFARRQQGQVHRSFGALFDGQRSLVTGHVRVHVAGVDAVDDDVGPGIRVERPLLHERKRADGHLGHAVRGRRPSGLRVVAGLGAVHELPDHSVQLVDGQLGRRQLPSELLAWDHGQAARGAGQVDNSRAGLEQREQSVAHGPQGEVVDAYRLLGLHAERLGGGRLEGDRRVVDQHVHARVVVGHELGESGHATGVGHVQLMELGLQAQLVQTVHRRPAPADVPGRQVNVAVEQPAQVLDDGVPDALVAARHYCQSGGTGGSHVRIGIYYVVCRGSAEV